MLKFILAGMSKYNVFDAFEYIQTSETVQPNDYEAAIIEIIFAKQRLACGICIIIAVYGQKKSIYETQADQKIGTVFTYVINV